MPRPLDDVDPAASPWHLLGSELRHWRDDVCRLSQQEAAVQALCDRGDLSKWERGAAHAHADVIARLDGVYGAGGRLVALHAVVAELDRHQTGTSVPNPTKPDEDGDMHRRAAMQLLAALGAGAVIPPGTLEALFSGVENAARIGVDDWEEVVWEHGLSYYTGAPGSLLHAVTGDLAEVSRLLRTTTPARTGLLRVSAQLAVLLGMELGDVGDLDAARRSWRMARHAADGTGDRDLQVWVRGWEAEYGFWSGRPAPVLARLAGDAVRIAKGSASSGLAEALRAQAFIAAAAGDVNTVRASLRDLDGVCSRLPETAVDDRTSPLWSFGARDAAWARAYSSGLVGDTTEAIRAVDEAITLCPPTFGGNLAHYELVRALALVRDGDAGGALDHAVATAREWPMSTIRRRTLGRILDALPEQGRELEAARELRSLTAEPTDSSPS